MSEGRLRLLQQLNLEPGSVQPVPAAMASLFRHGLPEQSSAMLVTVEEGAFTADYLMEGKLMYSRHFPIPPHEGASEGEAPS